MAVFFEFIKKVTLQLQNSNESSWKYFPNIKKVLNPLIEILFGRNTINEGGC